MAGPITCCWLSRRSSFRIERQLQQSCAQRRANDGHFRGHLARRLGARWPDRPTRTFHWTISHFGIATFSALSSASVAYGIYSVSNCASGESSSSPVADTLVSSTLSHFSSGNDEAMTFVDLSLTFVFRRPKNSNELHPAIASSPLSTIRVSAKCKRLSDLHDERDFSPASRRCVLERIRNSSDSSFAISGNRVRPGSG